jgi:Glycosyl hydrolases family 16
MNRLSTIILAAIACVFAATATAQVLVNQSGYNTSGSKRFTAPLAEDGTPFAIVSHPGGIVAFTGAITGGAGDFSAFEPHITGDYRVRLGTPPAEDWSHPFGIGPFWIERVSYQRMIQFFIDSRCGFGDATTWDVTTGKLSTGLAWRDSHQFSFELRTLIQWYAANPDAFGIDRMPLEGSYKGLRHTLPSDTPEIVRLIHWGTDLYLRGNLNHTLIKEELAYFLHYYPLFARWIPVSLYNETRDRLFAEWGNPARNRWNWYDISHTADLFQTYTVMGGTKGSFPPGHSIIPNLLMHAVALREGRADAQDYLAAARNQTQWIVSQLDPADPVVTKGQRMSEHILVPALAEFMLRDPAGPVAGVDAWLSTWADTVISRSENGWDFRKFSDLQWTPENPGSTSHPWWNEPGNIAGFPASALAAAARLTDPSKIARLKAIANSQNDQIFGRNPYNRHFSFRAAQPGYGFEGVESGWFSQHIGGLGILENSRGVLDASVKHPAFPYNPNEPPGYVEGWVAFNAAWNAAMTWAARDRSSLRFISTANPTSGSDGTITLELSAPLNFSRTAIESANIQITTASGDRETLRLSETGADSSLFRGRIFLGNTLPATIGDNLLQAAVGSHIRASYGHDVFAQVATTPADDSSGAGLIIAVSSLPDAEVGISYGPLTLASLNANPPVDWTIVGGSLPPGMQLLPDGTLAGTPQRAGAFPVRVRLRDAHTEVESDLMLTCKGLASPQPGYRLHWRDEFNGTAVDELKWQYRTGVRYWSTQLPQNVSVSSGLLHLHLRKETVGSTSYTAGGLISRDLFRYGYYEARLRVPPGSGWHTSFWMMRYNRPPDATVATELDVVENDSVTPLKYGVNVHRHLPLPHTTFGNTFPTTPSLSADFHVFGCEYTPQRIRYFFDGTLVQTVDATPFGHDDLNVWLTSIASPLGGTTSVDDSQLPAAALFDWVRYYQPFPAPTVEILSPAPGAVVLTNPEDRLHLQALANDSEGPRPVFWSLVSGPGQVTFSHPSATATTAVFSTPGEYEIACTASNEGGSSVDRLRVGVASPVTFTLREGLDGYTHTATLIRSDQKEWNAGMRDQLIVGRNSAPIRSVFSFDLSPVPSGSTIHRAELGLTTVGGSGTVGSLQLRELLSTPAEGTGTADGTTGSNLGTGTGATWNTRTGGSTANDLWNSPGGDFSPAILSSINGFDATVAGVSRILPDSPALLTAARNSLQAGTPLNLILSSANESSSTGFTRLASDDYPSQDSRPALLLQVTGNQLPAANPGPSPTVRSAEPALLAGSVENAASSLWTSLTEPAAVIIGNHASPLASAIFPRSGIYQLELAATNTKGTTSRILHVNVAPNPAVFDDWRLIHWPGASLSDPSSPRADPDHDGRPNLLEWALALDPARGDAFDPALVPESGDISFTFLRRRTAAGSATSAVEWADSPAGPWSAENVVFIQSVIHSDETETVTFRIPAPVTDPLRRFIRVRVNLP